MTVTAIVSLALLLRASWWILLALIPLSIAILAYNAAVQAALAYSEIAHVAFDLHRADLLAALRMELPRQQDTERTLNGHWCDLWRQGIPLPITVEYSANNDNNHATLTARAQRSPSSWRPAAYPYPGAQEDHVARWVKNAGPRRARAQPPDSVRCDTRRVEVTSNGFDLCAASGGGSGHE